MLIRQIAQQKVVKIKETLEYQGLEQQVQLVMYQLLSLRRC